MVEFWPFFAVFCVGFFIGLLLGRAATMANVYQERVAQMNQMPMQMPGMGMFAGRGQQPPSMPNGPA